MDGFGIPGKWMASFTLGGRAITNLYGFESFKLVEEAGNQLPTFELMFRTAEVDLLSYLNEGNVITAGMGVTQLDMSGIPLRIMSKKVYRADGATLRFILTGFYDAIDYANTSKVEISEKISGFTRMMEVVGKHFKPDFSMPSSNDSMNWIQHGIPDKDMVQQLWTRSDVGAKNFPMIGITSDGTFRLRTAEELTKGAHHWNFSNTEAMGGTTVPFHYDYEIHSNTGFSNYYQAYSQSSDIIDLDGGAGNIFNSTITTFLSQASGPEQSGSVGAKIAGALLHNENTHKNYHQAHNNNLANMSNMNATQIDLNNSDLFFNIKLLDVFLFSDVLEGLSASIQSFSGKWIVSQVTRAIENNKFHTMITGVRESMNNPQISS